MCLARQVSLGHFSETWYLITLVVSITRASFIIRKGRYHWVYFGFNYPNPCYDQAHGSCLRVLHLVRRGKALDTSSTSRHSVDSVMENVDPCPREGEGAEGSDHCRDWLSLFTQCPANGRSLGLLSWRAKDVLILDAKMSSSRTVPSQVCREKIFVEVFRWCLHRKHIPIQDLCRRLMVKKTDCGRTT